MKSQIPDTFLYSGEEYKLVALGVKGLISPQDYSIKPQTVTIEHLFI